MMIELKTEHKDRKWKLQTVFFKFQEIVATLKRTVDIMFKQFFFSCFYCVEIDIFACSVLQ